MLSLPSRWLPRHLPVLLRLTIPLLLLPLYSRTGSRGVGDGLAGPPDTGYGLLLLPVLSLLCGRPLQQLLLVQHLRRQLTLQMYPVESVVNCGERQ